MKEKRFIVVTRIDWDTDDDNEFDTLPKKIEIELSEDNVENITDIYELEDYVSDYISDEVGHCHFGFDMDIYFDTIYGLIHCAGRYGENETFYDMYDKDMKYYGEINISSLYGLTNKEIENQISENLELYPHLK